MKNFLPLSAPKPERSEEMSLKELIAHYHKIKPVISQRISEFRSIIKSGSNRDIFAEMCFCILTANANAVKCHEAIKDLCGSGMLEKAAACRIRPKLKGRARFHNKKADYIVGARGLFKEKSCINVLSMIDRHDVIGTRDRLVENIRGYGFKEASHFLRNIGLGADIAILDRHVLKNLMKYGVIDRMPKSVGPRKVYIDIEDKMRVFSGKIGVPMDELDLLFWSMQTGYVFK